MIEASGLVLVNPNTFSRVKHVIDYILDKSGVLNKYTHSIMIDDDDNTVLIKNIKKKVQDQMSLSVVTDYHI